MKNIKKLASVGAFAFALALVVNFIPAPTGPITNPLCRPISACCGNGNTSGTTVTGIKCLN